MDLRSEVLINEGLLRGSDDLGGIVANSSNLVRPRLDLGYKMRLALEITSDVVT